MNEQSPSREETSEARPPLTFVFRADASIEIGSGHVMRSLTVADRLRKDGHRCIFISRSLPGQLIDLVQSRGYDAYSLPPVECEAGPERPASAFHYESWLRGGWERDSADTIEVLDGLHVDWFVVDHYGIDCRWEEALAAEHPHAKIMVIDDLADRRHHTDLLLDQNLGRRSEDYTALVPQGAVTLLGLEFSLVRPEFLQHREYSLNRRIGPHDRISRVLLNLGGVDKDDVTTSLLRALERIPSIADDLSVDVVMGPTAPHLEQVRKAAAMSRFGVTVHAGTREMANLMANADLAVGAAGGTSWERCCMGLPSILVVLAENQRRLADELANHGAAAVVESEDLPSSLEGAWNRLSRDAQRREMSAKASRLVDGLGVERVRSALVGGGDK